MITEEYTRHTIVAQVADDEPLEDEVDEPVKKTPDDDVEDDFIEEGVRRDDGVELGGDEEEEAV